MEEIKGKVYGVSGPAVIAEGLRGVKMHTVCFVGKDGLIGEVIRIKKEMVTLQVYEETEGLKVGEVVVSTGRPLTALLGPGLLTGVFDGIQRPLYKIKEISGDFVARGVKVDPLDMERGWDFNPLKRPGDHVTPGDVLGSVDETERIVHKVMVPHGVSGTIKEIKSGSVTGHDHVVVLDDGETIGLFQEWPVRRPRPVYKKLSPQNPFVTGQRVFDTLFPVAEGGTAIVPGGFGTGKTVVEQTIAKFSRSDIVIYIGCGERGNEMTEVLTEFPRLKDPDTGMPINLRTVIVVNTSNMPVAAREASIYTGITIAEYYRDMGYNVALLADSISRWAEALREISSRLEEIPGEEGFPPYLSTRLGSFYERGGKAVCLGDGDRIGSITVISAVSPPGGDFSEPVTQASLRFAGALWALDPDLAYRRHFPAVNWQQSFSLYYNEFREWFDRTVSPEMTKLRARLMGLLQREAELREIVQIIGVEALQESDRIVMAAASIASEAFLKQSVFNEADAFNRYEKQYWLLKIIFAFLHGAEAALKRGVFVEKILDAPFRTRIVKMQNVGNEVFEEEAKKFINDMDVELTSMEAG
ncbi:MAG: V-type ATP synthase subunit A [Thermodesulfobacteriota bacterium]|nr:MAG: V-type ATP synthase subunit A [Thermodesulfobacteriota bacterium]